jgi:hypothetical protein
MQLPSRDGSGRPLGSKNSLVYEQFGLESLEAYPPDAGNGDTGILTTRDPSTVPGSHGLPTNFGPGRGRWTIRDIRFMSFECECQGEPGGNNN